MKSNEIIQGAEKANFDDYNEMAELIDQENLYFHAFLSERDIFTRDSGLPIVASRALQMLRVECRLPDGAPYENDIKGCQIFEALFESEDLEEAGGRFISNLKEKEVSDSEAMALRLLVHALNTE